MHKQQTILLVTVLVVGAIASAADEMTINKLPYRNIRITGLRDCQVVYERNNREETVPLADVDAIRLEREDELTQAEALAAEGKIDDALKQYLRARTAADREWVQQLIEFRRMWAINQAGRIDQAVDIWFDVLKANDASPNSQLLVPTNLAEAGEPANAAAFAKLEERRKQARSDDDKVLWKVIFDLQLRIAALEGDEESKQRLSREQLDYLSGGQQDVSAGLQSASVLMENPENAADVVNIIAGDLQKYTRNQLPQALLMLGKAQLILAEAADDSPKRPLLIDAGNSLMHVAVFFGGSPEAPEAYFLAGRANILLGNTGAARKAYDAVSQKYPDSPFAAKAAEAIQQLTE